MVLVPAVLVVDVPRPLAAELALETGHEARRVVLRRVDGAYHIRHEDARKLPAERAERRGNGGREERVVGLDLETRRTEPAVRGRAQRVTGRVSDFGEVVQPVGQVEAHVRERGVALDLGTNVR